MWKMFLEPVTWCVCVCVCVRARARACVRVCVQAVHSKMPYQYPFYTWFLLLGDNDPALYSGHCDQAIHKHTMGYVQLTIVQCQGVEHRPSSSGSEYCHPTSSLHMTPTEST